MDGLRARLVHGMPAARATAAPAFSVGARVLAQWPPDVGPLKSKAQWYGAVVTGCAATHTARACPERRTPLVKPARARRAMRGAASVSIPLTRGGALRAAGTTSGAAPTRCCTRTESATAASARATTSRMACR